MEKIKVNYVSAILFYITLQGPFFCIKFSIEWKMELQLLALFLSLWTNELEKQKSTSKKSISVIKQILFLYQLNNYVYTKPLKVSVLLLNNLFYLTLYIQIIVSSYLRCHYLSYFHQLVTDPRIAQRLEWQDQG